VINQPCQQCLCGLRLWEVFVGPSNLITNLTDVDGYKKGLCLRCLCQSHNCLARCGFLPKSPTHTLLAYPLEVPCPMSSSSYHSPSCSKTLSDGWGHTGDALEHFIPSTPPGCVSGGPEQTGMDNAHCRALTIRLPIVC
jgi:hypothetical protein